MLPRGRFGVKQVGIDERMNILTFYTLTLVVVVVVVVTRSHPY